jgi:AraC-like DNA-binding protein
MPGPTAYRDYAPGPALAATVECFWSSKGAARSGPSEHRVLPDGCMDILFDFRAEVRPPVTLVGTMSRALVVEGGGATDLFGIRFRPGALPAWLGLDAAELRDASAELACFATAFARDLWQRLGDAPAEARPAIVRKALPATPVDPLIAWCTHRIEAAGGALAIASLARSGVGARQIERSFQRRVGLSPKAFARVTRFRRLVAAAGSGRQGWADLAAACGFADQAHMVREFRALAGVTPTEHFGGRNVGNVQDGPRARG